MRHSSAVLLLIFAVLLLVSAISLVAETGHQRRPQRVRLYALGAVIGGLGEAAAGVSIFLTS